MKWIKQKAIEILIRAIVSLLEAMLSKQEKESFKEDLKRVSNPNNFIDE